VIEVILGKALICFLDQCHPILTGYSTPPGIYQLQEYQTTAPGYGGSVLEFKQDSTGIFAIHRIYVRDKKTDRLTAIKFGTPAFRRHVTMGCINVEPEVYQELIDQPGRTLYVHE
jgi:hypothetical protein